MEAIRRDDYGFFGPDSPSWKVWASPTALIGFQRAVVLEHFDPFLAGRWPQRRHLPILGTGTGRWPTSSPLPCHGRTAIEVSGRADADPGRAGDRSPDALQRQPPGRAAVDPHHRLAFSARATSSTGPDRCHRRRSRGSGRIASPPSCRPASRRTFPRHATRCGSTRRRSAGYAPPNTPTAQCILLRRGTRRAAVAAAGFWRPRPRDAAEVDAAHGNVDQPAVVDAAVTPIARAWVRGATANNLGRRRPPHRSGRRGAGPAFGGRPAAAPVDLTPAGARTVSRSRLAIWGR
jgi:hypothetical protein